MKIAVLGAGAMGSVIGGLLAKAGNDVTLVDVSKPTVDAISANGLKIEDKAGAIDTIRLRATDQPSSIGPVDLLLVFVKCYHTETAVTAVRSLIAPQTTVLSLQNGWGNGPRIARIVGEDKLLLGVCYHSATVTAPGHVLHAGKGMTFMGEANGKMTERLARMAKAFTAAGIEVTTTPDVLKEIWSKLALNVCTLPTSALLRFYAPQLIEHEPMLDLMRALLREVVAVAQAQGIALDFDEHWEAITGLLKRCGPNAKSSMLQDVEKGRRTEIDVINGAIIEAGQRLGIATPYNDVLVKLIKSLEGTFNSA
jgi:2-dehydropantoate 2-reductase